MNESVWHTKSPEEVLTILDTNKHGLSEHEAERRLLRDGRNLLPEAKPEHVIHIFLRQFQNPLIYILMAAAGAVFFLGEVVDAVIIAAVLLLNALVGAVQEGRAQNTLLALKRFVNTKAIVLRDGKELIITDGEVVTGDIILLFSGDKIPADARIINAKNLKVDEASLTGESEAVNKFSELLENVSAPVLEQKNMVFKGTVIVAGEGQAVVVATGSDTSIGQVAKQIAGIETNIPLKANIRNLSHLIIGVTIFMSFLLFSIGVYSGKTAIEMFATGVSISVSVIPEGLPIALTLILATGVWRMGKRNALVKRLQAVEALGQASIIAVDKTGTITKNEMVIQEVYIDGKFFEISGIGYEPTGKASFEGEVINPPDYPSLLYAGKIATFCANARTMYSEDDGSWRVSGDPTEAAMFVLGTKLGFDKDALEHSSPLVGEIPFEYDLKYHVMVHNDNGEKLMTVVGAPEVILSLSNKIWSEESEKSFKEGDLDTFNDAFLRLSERGLRVIAFATTKEVPDVLDPKKIKNLTLTGFYGMKDALRDGVRDATNIATEAGLRVVMITGDHKATAVALARDAGIHKEGDMALTGEELEEMTGDELKEILLKVSVFARVTPEHKLRIVNTYKSMGEIVAMTGDGVNDAPSLVAADLGVAMGKIGTEVAKEASDIILLDDNFGSIVGAIEEGRSIYKTIRKVVLYLLSTSVGELLVLTGSLLLGMPLPLLPAQIIWLNFVTDGFLDVALALEPKEKNLLREDFKRPNKYLIDSLMVQRMLLMALPMMIGTLILFGEHYQTDLAKAWTMSLTLLAAFQWFNAWNCRSDRESIFSAHPFENRFLVGATLAAVSFQLLAVYNPFFQKFLRTVPLEFSDWIIILSFASSIVLVEEVRKFIVRHSPEKLPRAVRRSTV